MRLLFLILVMPVFVRAQSDSESMICKLPDSSFNLHYSNSFDNFKFPPCIALMDSLALDSIVVFESELDSQGNLIPGTSSASSLYAIQQHTKSYQVYELFGEIKKGKLIEWFESTYQHYSPCEKAENNIRYQEMYDTLGRISKSIENRGLGGIYEIDWIYHGNLKYPSAKTESLSISNMVKQISASQYFYDYHYSVCHEIINVSEVSGSQSSNSIVIEMNDSRIVTTLNECGLVSTIETYSSNGMRTSFISMKYYSKEE